MPKVMKLFPLLNGSPVARVLAALAALAFFVISESSYREASSRLEALGQQSTARATIESLRRSLTDAQAGQRGYLLTERPDYLPPYAAARARAQASLDRLNRYYADDASAQALMQRMTQASHDLLSQLQRTLALHDQDRQQDWRGSVLGDAASAQMAAVNQASEALLAAQTARLEDGRKRIMLTLMLNRIGISAMAVLSLVALYMYLRQTSALVRLREAQGRAVRAERDRLELDVLDRTAQLTELTRHLQTVREDERNRLARELHDELGALLTAAKLDVARLKSRLGVPTPEVAERLQHLIEGLNSVIALKRRIVEDLRPSSLSNLGLVAALEILVREWSKSTEIAVDSRFAPVRLQPSGELTVYRLVQEALTNISKYAHASRVTVRLSAADGLVHVSVHDDGVGFDLANPRNHAHGLLGMRFRLEAEGGRLRLHSEVGHGASIEADLPQAAATLAVPDAALH